MIAMPTMVHGIYPMRADNTTPTKDFLPTSVGLLGGGAGFGVDRAVELVDYRGSIRIVTVMIAMPTLLGNIL